VSGAKRAHPVWCAQGDHRDQAYEAFVNSLKLFDAYAPAFTAMGIWYLEHASPPDANRASKCFQKAFELDATQAEAAKRLATGYAEEGEWALVNLVSKRVMEGEGGLEGGLSGTEGTPANKFLPTNAWAWKASGAVQMVSSIAFGLIDGHSYRICCFLQHYKQYNLAAQAFQVALRAEPEDAAVWTRLGEAYVRSGRHVASLKALYQALEFSPDSWICYYHIGGVQRELGSFALAISAYEKALDMRRDEPGTIIALSEAWLALGKSERQIGLRERAYRSTLHCLKHLTAVLGQKPYRHTNWKLFAEACLNISGCITHKEDLSEAFTAIRPTLEHMSEIDDEKTASVTEVTSVASLLRLNEFSRKDLIKTSIVVYAYRANLLKFDTKLAEVPLYDKACALHLLATVLLETEPESVQIYPCQKAAALAMKQALDIDPSSPTMWNAFAVVSAVASPQLAQHAYVTAIELQPRVSCTERVVVAPDLALLSTESRHLV
jgi:superkiller protein 3